MLNIKHLTTLLLTLLVLGGCSQEPLKLLCYVQDETFELENEIKGLLRDYDETDKTFH